MDSEKALHIVLDYIQSQDTHYALLLNGAWGSGKTHFWKHSIQPRLKDHDLSPIYLSLNGIDSVSSLEYQFFLKLIPFLNKKGDKNFFNISRLLLNLTHGLTKKYLNSTLSDIFKGVSIDTFNFSQYIICFDDLERSTLSIASTLGFINNLVEHKNLRVIVLANEQEINAGVEYKRIREKVIGRDIKFTPNLIEIIPNLFNKYIRSPKFHQYLVDKQSYFLRKFNHYKIVNLRILFFYFDFLERLYPYIVDNGLQLIDEIANFSLFITNEYKLGNLSSLDYGDYKELDIITEYHRALRHANLLASSVKDHSVSPKTYADYFYDTYIMNNNLDYAFYPSIYDYILSGYLNEEMLLAEINERKPEFIPQEIKDLKRLLNHNFYELSDPEFEELSKSVLQNAENGKYIIYDYIPIANLFHLFSREALISQNHDQINDILKNGIMIAKDKAIINERLHENTTYLSHSDSNAKEIQDIVDSIHHELKVEVYKSNSAELINCLSHSGDPQELTHIFSNHVAKKEFFQYMDGSALVNALLTCSNKLLLQFDIELKRRYNSVNIGEYLYDDIILLRLIKDDLTKFVEKKDDIGRIRMALIRAIVETTNNAIDHLEKSAQ